MFFYFDQLFAYFKHMNILIYEVTLVYTGAAMTFPGFNGASCNFQTILQI